MADTHEIREKIVIEVQEKLDKVTEKARKLGTALDALTRDFQKQISFATNKVSKNLDRSGVSAKKAKKEFKSLFNWWKRFGQVAVGFTLAYRAINFVEEGIRRVVDAVREGIGLSGELASIQARMALWGTIFPSNAKDFADAMHLAAVNVNAFRHELPDALSTVEDLTQGMDELAQHGVFATEQNMHKVVQFVDLTAMVAKASGSTVNQVRQEFQALFEGNIRAGNTLLMLLRNMGVDTENLRNQLKAGIDVAENFDKIVSILTEHVDEFKEAIWKRDPQAAFQRWHKEILVLISDSVDLATVYEHGTSKVNIFAEVLNSHIESLKENKTLTRDWSVAMVDLAHAFDWALEGVEKIFAYLPRLISGIASVYDWLKIGLNGWKMAFFNTLKEINQRIANWLWKAGELAKKTGLNEFAADLFDASSGMAAEAEKAIEGYTEALIAGKKAYKDFIKDTASFKGETVTGKGLAGADKFRIGKDIQTKITSAYREIQKTFDKLVKQGKFVIAARLLDVIKSSIKLQRVAVEKEIQNISDLYDKAVKSKDTEAAEGLRVLLDTLIARSDELSRKFAGLDKVIPAAKLKLKVKELTEAFNAQKTALGKDKDAIVDLARTYLSTVNDMINQQAGLLDEATIAKLNALKSKLLGILSDVDTQKSFWMALKEGVRDYVYTAKTLYADLKNATLSNLRTMEDAFIEFTKTGKLSWRDMVNTMLEDWLRMAYRMYATKLFTSFMGMVGGSSETLSSVASADYTGYATAGFHNGGDTPSFKRFVDPAIFAYAPRLHNGLANDEFPAILQRGETVIPKDAKPAAPSITVNVINRTGTETEARQEGPKWDGRQWVIDVMLDAVNRRSDVRSAFGIA